LSTRQLYCQLAASLAAAQGMPQHHATFGFLVLALQPLANALGAARLLLTSLGGDMLLECAWWTRRC
jgi:hypothetical protein